MIIAIMLATIILCILNYIVLPEQIVAAYGFQNGERVILYGEKSRIIINSLLRALGGSGLWMLFTKYSRKKLEEDPTLVSHRLKHVLANIIGFLFAVSGLLMNIICLLLN